MEKLVRNAQVLFNVHITGRQVLSLMTYEKELLAWNQKFNLTAIRDVEAIRVKHFLDSFSCVLAWGANPQQLCTQAMPHGDGWHAPGLRANDPGLRAIAQRYDCLLFDASLDAPDWLPLPDTVQTLILEVNAAHASMLQAYRVMKTLAHQESGVSIGLLADAAACDTCRRPVRRFSGEHSVRQFTAPLTRMMHLLRWPLECRARRGA